MQSPMTCLSKARLLANRECCLKQQVVCLFVCFAMPTRFYLTKLFSVSKDFTKSVCFIQSLVAFLRVVVRSIEVNVRGNIYQKLPIYVLRLQRSGHRVVSLNGNTCAATKQQQQQQRKTKRVKYTLSGRHNENDIFIKRR